ncbi:EAL domain-containing protein [Acidisphaera sp. L21]|uniref:EAL domain-containing protein n=1 Tax=Acidisphaera sp. L21 TaxID=1641851 RepID=UPI00131D708D|nr:EAL domain-containing protein [Acidisphaera sp. L21]
MAGPNTFSRAARQVLLLCVDPAWANAARLAIDRSAGESLLVAESPQDALNRLVKPSHDFSHLLMEPKAAGPYVGDLLGVTSGEMGSQVKLILLGEAAGFAGRKALAQAYVPADLEKCLHPAAATASSGPPTMSTSDIAVNFQAADVECRFQPIVRLQNRRAAGMEALARLRHPDHGTIAPDQFIPQIERAGLSLRLTEAVAQGAMAAVDPGFLDRHDLFMTINLPLDVLLFPEALTRIDMHRRTVGIGAHRILIELTESRPVSDIPPLASAVEHWRDAGYQVAIDDMGPEMMNQLDLFDLPFNVVKLDKEVVLRSEANALARSYLQRTVDNAHRRSLSVIAEGIENEAMWNRMRDLGVEYAQGFLIGRPLPASALPSWLEGWSSQDSLPPDREPS